jgi:RimJ/RimL family protein N-acetyltransferase
MTLPVFETARLTLRPITTHDAEGLHEAYGNADAMRYWDLLPSRDVSQTAERIATSADADPRRHGMGAIRTHAGRFVGTHLNVHRIEAHIEPETLSSRRLAAKLGFTEEGLLRDWLCIVGEFRCVVMYSRLRTERSRPS